MTLNTIKYYFESDHDLINYYDPTSNVTSNEEAIADIYHKLIEHGKEKECKFIEYDIGYIYYSDKLLISFCVRKECRDKENLAYFGNLIKSNLGLNFDCYLFNKNRKAIGFLERIGMKQTKSNDIITLLSLCQ